MKRSLKHGSLFFLAFLIMFLGQAEKALSHCELPPAGSNMASQPEAQPDSAQQVGTDAAVFRVGGDVSPPKVVFKISPDYSWGARICKHQGTSVLKMVVQPDGTVRDVKVAQPLGLGLDEKAIEAVKQWRFDPAKKKRVPVAVAVIIEVTFELFNASNYGPTRRSAEQGDAFAQVSLGIAYEIGAGIRQDFQKANEWYRKAAENGMSDAMFFLGDIYEDGRGVAQDYVQAYMWYSLAADKNVPYAKEARDRVVSKMTSTQVEEARTIIQSWKAVPTR